jgi:UDP-N-acetyl-D-mannosaminuronate dehydrogenase
LKIAIVGIGYVGLANAIMLDQQKSIMTFDIEKSFKKFTDNSDLIIANRIDTKIKPFEKKIFSRSISDEN